MTCKKSVKLKKDLSCCQEPRVRFPERDREGYGCASLLFLEMGLARGVSFFLFCFFFFLFAELQSIEQHESDSFVVGLGGVFVGEC